MSDFWSRLKAYPFHDEKAVSTLADKAGDFAVNFVVALIILAVTVWLAGLLSRLTRRALARVPALGGSDSTIANFSASIIRYGILIVGLIVAVQQLGVKPTSVVAVLGAASLAVGLALQGTLGNVAAGVMLLLLRPYRLGDHVELAGRTGNVLTLDLFVTVLSSSNGLRLTIPNSKIFGEVIVNYTTSGRRRIELAFGLDYSDDLDKALAVLLKVADHDQRVLSTPEPTAKVTELRDSSVICKLDCWVSPQDYGDAAPDLLKVCKEALEAAGLHFPYPHQVGLDRRTFLGEGEPAVPASKAASRAKPKT